MNIDCNSLVLDYLVHRCYKNTAKALLKDITKLEQYIYIPPQTKQSQILERDIQWTLLDARKSLIEYIEQGNLVCAFEIIEKNFPVLFQQKDSESILFKLRCQHFIEIIRSGSELDAICYAQKHLKPTNHKLKEQVREVTALIAYKDPFQSQSKHLLTQERRQALAQELNSTLLGLHQMSHQSSIEKLTKQHVVVNKELEMIDIKEKKIK